MKRLGGGPSYRACDPPGPDHSVEKNRHGRAYVVLDVTDAHVLATGALWDQLGATDRFALVILATMHVDGRYTATTAARDWRTLDDDTRKQIARGLQRLMSLYGLHR